MIVGRDRQAFVPGCRAGVMATVLLTAFAQSATAQVGIGVEVTQRAPSPIVVTATVGGDEPVVAYDWSTLPTVERCRAASCTYDEPLSACRSVRAEVTTLRGDVASAERFACVDDERGAPPRARIELAASADGRQVRVVGVAGDEPVAWSRLWIDSESAITDDTWTTLPEDDGCHAVDAVVADRSGRIGVTRKQICANDAPRAWVGVDRLCPPIGTPQTFCVEVDHPLGLDVETSSTSDVAIGCATPNAPGGLAREVFAGVDERGARVFASVLRCGAGASPRLFFASLPEGRGGASGAELTLEPELYGGTPPFEVELEGVELLRVRDADTSPKLDVRLPTVAEAIVAVRIVLEDAEGLTAEATTNVSVSSSGVTPVSEGAGCRAAPGEAGGAWLLLALLVLVRRRS